jgi:hypothetical protein
VSTNCTSDFVLTRDGTLIFNNSEQSLVIGTYNFSVTRKDNENYSYFYDSSNFTITYILTQAQNYNTSTYETKSESFYLNISTIPAASSNVGAFLVYNGTYYPAEYTCSGNYCQIWRTIDIPLMTSPSLDSENKSFYWDVVIFGDFGTGTLSTTPINQNVSNIKFENCASGSNTYEFSVYNETDRQLVNSTFKAAFKFWLGDGSVKDAYNFSGNSNSTYLFCFNENMTYQLSSDIELDNRGYQFAPETHDSGSNSQTLYVPDDYQARSVIVEVKDQGLVPLKNIVVNITRYYPDTNKFEPVENKITDEFGQAHTSLIENYVKYNFDFYNLAGTLLKHSDKMTIVCKATPCIVPFIIETTSNPFEIFDNLSLYSYSLSFNNNTNIVTFSWSDQRGELATHRFEVIRYSFNGSSVVCNVTSNAIVSSLSCDVGSSEASYTAQAFRKVAGEDRKKITSLNFKVGDKSGTFGIEGLFWVFILLMVCVGIGVYDPKVGAIVYGAGFIIMGLIHIIYMPVSVFFANTILVILFVWAVKT